MSTGSSLCITYEATFCTFVLVRLVSKPMTTMRDEWNERALCRHPTYTKCVLTSGTCPSPLVFSLLTYYLPLVTDNLSDCRNLQIRSLQDKWSKAWLKAPAHLCRAPATRSMKRTNSREQWCYGSKDFGASQKGWRLSLSTSSRLCIAITLMPYLISVDENRP